MEAQQAIQSMSTVAVFVSGGGLLLLSLNARLSSVFNRVRLLHDREETPETARLLSDLERRARWLRNSFVCALLSVGMCLISCLLIGLGTFWPAASLVGFLALFVGLLAMFASVSCYLTEVLLALPSLDHGHIGSKSADQDPSHQAHSTRQDAA